MRTSLALGGFARHALLLGLDLMLQAFKRAVRNLLRRLVLRRLRGMAALFGATGALGFACRALLLDGFATSTLLLGLLALCLGALFSKLLCLFRGQLAGAFLDFRSKVLANFLHGGLSQHARVAFSGNLHLMELVKHVLARHVELLRQLMHSHTGHIPLLYIFLASSACAAISAAIRS